eukprot:TRINITY_DN11615_c0_g1_i1.p1 TRINITY_DN11615_c0_g1~~TRINITY_DN11615_c0_g1_i1.p1  ORF type:complete len:406 (-),score=55.13 TRINITY_DN11615_c0_g1_i1:125-1342(-)
MWTLAAGLCQLLVIVIFIFVKNFAFMFIGLMVCTVFLARALAIYAPKLLGKAFVSVLIFFVLLTVSLTFGTLSVADSTQKGNTETSFMPTALGPGARGYGAKLSGDNDLPVAFYPTNLGRRHSGYPICSTTWGNPNVSKVNKFNIFDLAMLAKASYAPQDLTPFALGAMFNGTELADFEIISNQPDDKLGRCVVVDFPRQKVRVIALRGTAIAKDVYADLSIYASIAVLQFVGHIFPVIDITPIGVLEHLVGKGPAELIFGRDDLLQERFEHARRYKEKATAKGYQTIITGHSLGGAIVGVAAARLGLEGIGFSAPGLRYQAKRMDVTDQDLQYDFTVVQPGNDIVPKIDEQRGMVEWIKCELAPLRCHSLVHTTCEMWSQCGDPRGRDYRQSCSEWYSSDDLNW